MSVNVLVLRPPMRGRTSPAARMYIPALEDIHPAYRGRRMKLPAYGISPVPTYNFINATSPWRTFCTF